MTNTAACSERRLTLPAHQHYTLPAQHPSRVWSQHF